MADSDELIVDFGLTGAMELVKEYREIANSVDKSVGPMRSFTRSLGQAEMRSGRLAMHMMVVASSVQAIGRASLPKLSAGGSGALAAVSPAAQLRQQAQMVNAQAAMVRAQANMGRATNPAASGRGGRNGQPPTFAQALKNAIFSTRFTANNGHLHLMPLVGRTLQVLNSIGGVGAAAGGAAMAIGALGAVAHMAAEKIGELTSARNIGGGTYGETGRAAGLGAALGMSGGDVARMARELSANTASNPFAMQAGIKTGSYDPFGGMPGFGEMDKMKGFFKAVDAILAAPSDKEAQRLARQFGGDMEKILDLRAMSPALRKQLMEGTVFTKEDERSAADFRGTTALLSQAWDKLLIASTPLIDAFGTLVSVAADFVTVIGDGMKWLKGELDQAVKNGFMGPEMGRGTAKGDEKTAQEKHTDALDRNTDALVAQLSMQRQVFGGGGRAAGAVPANFRGTANAALNLGAFSL